MPRLLMVTEQGEKVKRDREMRINGFYQYTNKDGEVKKVRNVKFESTGVKDLGDGHVIWRKIDKNGQPTNIFAEQFIPNMPWAVGKWFIRLNGGMILERHPELKVETEKSKTMSDSEYIAYLHSTYHG